MTEAATVIGRAVGKPKRQHKQLPFEPGVPGKQTRELQGQRDLTVIPGLDWNQPIASAALGGHHCGHTILRPRHKDKQRYDYHGIHELIGSS
jgi:hypothetical protein